MTAHIGMLRSSFYEPSPISCDSCCPPYDVLFLMLSELDGELQSKRDTLGLASLDYRASEESEAAA